MATKNKKDQKARRERRLPIGVKGTSQQGATGNFHHQQFYDEVARTKHHRDEYTDEEIARWRIGARKAAEGNLTKPEDYPAGESPVTKLPPKSMTDMKRSERRLGWRTHKDLYTNPDVTEAKGKVPRYIAPDTFTRTEMAPEHAKFVKEQLDSKSGVFWEGVPKDTAIPGKGKYPPVVRNRYQKYTQALQRGESHEEAMQSVRRDDRGQWTRASGGPAARRTGKEPQYNRNEGRKTRFQTVVPKPQEFRFGADAASIDKIKQLQEKFPDETDRELVRMQTFQRMSMADELRKNAAWAKETQRAHVLGGTPGKEDGKRVVVFTTALGVPAVSVPSDSLIGQYVIKQRKKLAQHEGIGKGADLKGEFPAAVRDLHIIELATGVGLGAQGAWGAFSRNGWRVGKKKSKGYGKSIPMGQRLLYDSSTGRPIYDQNGNVRFSEGASRPFDVGTSKNLGLRIFVG